MGVGRAVSATDVPRTSRSCAWPSP